MGTLPSDFDWNSHGLRSLQSEQKTSVVFTSTLFLSNGGSPFCRVATSQRVWKKKVECECRISPELVGFKRLFAASFANLSPCNNLTQYLSSEINFFVTRQEL